MNMTQTYFLLVSCTKNLIRIANNLFMSSATRNQLIEIANSRVTMLYK